MFDPKKIARRHKFNKFKGVGKQVNNDINAKKVHQKYLGWEKYYNCFKFERLSHSTNSAWHLNWQLFLLKLYL